MTMHALQQQQQQQQQQDPFTNPQTSTGYDYAHISGFPLMHVSVWFPKGRDLAYHMAADWACKHTSAYWAVDGILMLAFEKNGPILHHNFMNIHSLLCRSTLNGV